MASNERSILTHQKQMLLLPDSAFTPDSEEQEQSGASENGKSKRRKVEPSPLQNQFLFDSQQIVDLLKGNPEDSDLSRREREFELNRKEAEFEMSMKERALELKIKTENLELSRALLESAKTQSELMRQLLDMKNSSRSDDAGAK